VQLAPFGPCRSVSQFPFPYTDF
jgi:hypothetical protein